ncbi:MAG: cytochrome-c oxidase, cbb3-type subunit III [Oceanospirillaceae bacterium]|mgnify:FL=1|uniref:cytochrome-c oxidase, cbb3-type subunit III n=1 Tax=unclassified Thalassolituus TaxID=2624967 RepID=UPI000C686C1A|nr:MULTISPECIES: cytochrome-c oxidase, cbb3-type subunit III [unclassified Thalassolituus]MAS23804.1 cytochrome-c oxidase, cbb3-type subunit III [Oceanospirillaceae bacterium]MAX98241.1 cytochrome-c oxidase, cbb3-type subunit III [Oceanospirillaceae bacterium]MBM94620.1 cytochrome-c oxidase, cbb3-type subunit III [Oceanospirillaceae bacterium]MBS53606.1 cytochrome-c oxidase, cbb3-type subunit III [Oceanospirillaceae bacterium]|tara:strand:+ start:659 stop:1579 length:921 start_codon:yes stop_codon:yes gene_type:complete
MLSTFWQVWIAVITLGSIIGCGVLIQYTSRGMRKEETDQTTGHDYDGIQEFDNPLPRWWVFMFWGTIVFGFAYLGVYGFGNFNGLLTVEVDGEPVTWTAQNQWKAEVQAFDKTIAPLYEEYAATPVTELIHNEEALQSGQRLFKSNCSVCHGSNAKGAQGFPNLTDTDWLYGGSPEQIKQTITMGRQGAMPAWGAVLGDEGTANMVEYVRSLSGLKHDAAAAEAAAPQFTQICAACHGADGKGMQLLGAPNLTDDVWLYGGSSKQIEFTLKNGRNGKMPAHAEILGSNADAKIHLLTTYVYSLSNE